MDLHHITDFLNDYLQITRYPDSSVNGLQIEGAINVEKAVFAVDASMESFMQAVELDAELLVCHHGIIWDGIGRITGLMKERIKFLLENELSLYAAHIPLDAHPEIGNNALILRALGIEPEERFGEYRGVSIGFAGYADMDFHDALERLERRYGKVDYMKFGGDETEKVAVVSGRGSAYINEAVEKNVDLFITGEIEHSAYHQAKDGRINVIFIGHYNSETPGIKALMNVVEDKMGIDTEFIDIPTRL